MNQVGPGGEIEEQLGDRAESVLRIQQRLSRQLGGPGGSRLPHHDRIHSHFAHPGGEWSGQT